MESFIVPENLIVHPDGLEGVTETYICNGCYGCTWNVFVLGTTTFAFAFGTRNAETQRQDLSFACRSHHLQVLPRDHPSTLKRIVCVEHFEMLTGVNGWQEAESSLSRIRNKTMNEELQRIVRSEWRNWIARRSLSIRRTHGQKNL